MVDMDCHMVESMEMFLMPNLQVCGRSRNKVDIPSNASRSNIPVCFHVGLFLSTLAICPLINSSEKILTCFLCTESYMLVP